MPKAYMRMKEKFKKQGLSDKSAKTKAAKIYNANNPGAPVTPGAYEKRMAKKKKR